MKNIKALIIIALALTTSAVFGQSHINVQGHFNYWKHTDVFGPGVGLGYNYQLKRLNFAINYDFGYGTINRFKNIDNINYDNWTTVFIKEQQGKWNEYLGFIGQEDSNELHGSSDYGKQHQVSLQVGYSIIDKTNAELVLSSGIYSAIVEHFYTFTNIPIHYIDLPLTYTGPLNYIPSTSQKIYTYGVNFELAYKKKKNSKTISPFIVGGIGPKYGSYLSVGVRMNTALVKN